MTAFRGGGLALLIALLTLIVEPAVAQEREQRPRACPPAGAKALAKRGDVVVYRAPRDRDGERSVRACSRRTLRDHDLIGYGDTRRPIRIAGNWVATVGGGWC